MSSLGPSAFADHFSAHAAAYAEFRPCYPTALGLVSRFAQVRVTDASAEQITQATPHLRVCYAVAQYESGLPEKSTDLVTAGQALHWFDADAFARDWRGRPGRTGPPSTSS